MKRLDHIIPDIVELNDDDKASLFAWLVEQNGEVRGMAPGRWVFGDQFCVIDYREDRRPVQE